MSDETVAEASSIERERGDRMACSLSAGFRWLSEWVGGDAVRVRARRSSISDGGHAQCPDVHVQECTQHVACCMCACASRYPCRRVRVCVSPPTYRREVVSLSVSLSLGSVQSSLVYFQF